MLILCFTPILPCCWWLILLFNRKHLNRYFCWLLPLSLFLQSATHQKNPVRICWKNRAVFSLTLFFFLLSFACLRFVFFSISWNHEVRWRRGSCIRSLYSPHLVLFLFYLLTSSYPAFFFSQDRVRIQGHQCQWSGSSKSPSRCHLRGTRRSTRQTAPPPSSTIFPFLFLNMTRSWLFNNSWRRGHRCTQRTSSQRRIDPRRCCRTIQHRRASPSWNGITSL